MQIRLLFFLFLLLSASQQAAATTYYVRIAGNDAQTGTTPATAWRSIARVNAATLQPGDQVLFEGEQTFVGGLQLKGTTQGTAAQPIVFGSYGRGWATISSGGTYGLLARNAGGIELRRLYFAGSGRLNNKSAGVVFVLDSAATQLPHLVLDSLDVSGYQQAGVTISSQRAGSGYSGVRITNSRVHDNGEAGISSYGSAEATHRNWYVANCRLYNNTGRLDLKQTRTGYGLLLAHVTGAVVEQCEAYNNGRLNAYPAAGPAGIGAWRCTNLTVQQCKSYSNRSGTVRGGGFALEGGCATAVVQYNYAHDNEGPGFAITQPDTMSVPSTNLTVRYNISDNDARRANHGALAVLAPAAAERMQRISLHNNTVLVTKPANNSVPVAVQLEGGAASGITLRNNLLQTTDGLTLVDASLTTGVRLEGNCYWSEGSGFTLRWNNATYTSLPTWRQATTQEQLGDRPCGLSINPQLRTANQSDATTATPTAAATAANSDYRLAPTSALVGAGLNLWDEFRQEAGPRDYFGLATPAAGVRGSIGASESPAVTLPTATPAVVSGAWCAAYPTRTHELVRVVLTNTPTANVAIRLYDMQGRTCLTRTLHGRETEVPVAGLASGVYVLRVEANAQHYQQRIVVE
ncbi:right-handed parallel beta-helix repeat-containing protein [Hymenobacter profundi]|uniref:Right-handed parallel beta-helix repeat-containing protein n=1 Tax=Hymenobacter profundi TaxID=1982110 RepID=A0ABS6X502_9BACT|nr:right-handed parallel beta-helix repeat-containing protein [Hymenobacter profundi]MBW3130917.1 right-handed parallel beta-helix repeat-containing protein [Hymenobacter profundi]